MKLDKFGTHDSETLAQKKVKSEKLKVKNEEVTTIGEL